MFIGYELTNQSRNMLLEKFPPKYNRVICHHITEKYGVPKDAEAPPIPESVQVVGYIDSGDGVEGLLVSVNGSTERRDGNSYHITLSIDQDTRKPADTNKYTKDATPVNPLDIEVTPKNFW
jgi:hypothetical protein